MAENGYQYNGCDHSEVTKNVLKLFCMHMSCTKRLSMLNQKSVVKKTKGYLRYIKALQLTFILSNMVNSRLQTSGKDVRQAI